MMFNGAKLAILSGGCVLTMLRDNKPDIPFPNMWDFPGGGREGDESPQECVLRETREEFGLQLSPDDLIYRTRRDGVLTRQGHIWFFGAQLSGFDAGRIRFGDEGQKWEMMPVKGYLTHPRAIVHPQEQLRGFLNHIEKGV